MIRTSSTIYLSLRDRIFINLQAKIVWLQYVFEEKKTGFHYIRLDSNDLTWVPIIRYEYHLLVRRIQLISRGLISCVLFKVESNLNIFNNAIKFIIFIFSITEVGILKQISSDNFLIVKITLNARFGITGKFYCFIFLPFIRHFFIVYMTCFNTRPTFLYRNWYI